VSSQTTCLSFLLSRTGCRLISLNIITRPSMPHSCNLGSPAYNRKCRCLLPFPCFQAFAPLSAPPCNLHFGKVSIPPPTLPIPTPTYTHPPTHPHPHTDPHPPAFMHYPHADTCKHTPLAHLLRRLTVWLARPCVGWTARQQTVTEQCAGTGTQKKGEGDLHAWSRCFVWTSM
jgi:hypothetical protein